MSSRTKSFTGKVVALEGNEPQLQLQINNKTTESVYDILKTFFKDDNRYNTISQSQYNKLFNIMDIDIFKPLNKDKISIFYQTIGFIKESGYEKTLQFFEDHYKSELSWTDQIQYYPTLDKYRREVEIEADLLRNKPIESSSGYICLNCKSTNTISFQKQVRSADEPMSTFISCLSCGYKYREG